MWALIAVVGYSLWVTSRCFGRLVLANTKP